MSLICTTSPENQAILYSFSQSVPNCNVGEESEKCFPSFSGFMPNELFEVKDNNELCLEGTLSYKANLQEYK